MTHDRNSQWTISPFPEEFDCAFTIVHDADDAYSERLAPLFDVFDEYGIKITASVFAFWDKDDNPADLWTKWNTTDPFGKPKAVPLAHPPECEFYESLAANGHEIALHTASDGHDTRDVIIDAFEFYKSVFGHHPATYVEHRDNLQNLCNSGSDPRSPYYINDVLSTYQPWVWLVSPSSLPYNGYGRYFDVLSTQKPLYGWTLVRMWGVLKGLLKTGRLDAQNGRDLHTMMAGGTPFDRFAAKKYGLAKAFRRSGRRDPSSGDGFLAWYSKPHVDALEAEHGLALVYTHLNTKWLDRRSKTMRREIEECLAYIASKNVWLATAAQILNRFRLSENTQAERCGPWLRVTNQGAVPIGNVAVLAPRGVRVRCVESADNECRVSEDHKKVVIQTLGPGEMFVFEVLSVGRRECTLKRLGASIARNGSRLT